MSKSYPIQVNFSSGQVGDVISNRSDLAEVQAGVKKCVNFIPLPQGALSKRDGRIIIAKIDGASNGKIINFNITDSKSYAIIITDDGKIRFATKEGLYNNPAQPAGEIIPNPNLVAGAPVVTYREYNNRTDNTTTDREEIERYPSAPTAETRVTDFRAPAELGNGDEFTAIHIDIPIGKENDTFNCNLYLQFSNVSGYNGYMSCKLRIVKDLNDLSNPIVDIPFADIGSTRFSFNALGASKVYLILNADQTDGSIEWNGAAYVYPYYELLASSLSVVSESVAESILELPHSFGDINYNEIQYAISPDSNHVYLAHRSAEPTRIVFDIDTGLVSYEKLITDSIITTPPADWASTNNYPGAVTFSDDRLWFAGTRLNKTKLYSSRVSNHVDFASPTKSAVADDPLVLTLAKYGDIKWIASTTKLLIGTGSGEFTLTSEGNFVSAGDVGSLQQSSYGCARIQPVIVGNRIVYVTSDGKKLRDFSYDDREASWLSKELTFNDPGITASGIFEITFLQNPDNLIKCKLGNGKIAVCSYQKHLNIVGLHEETGVYDIKSIGQIIRSGTSETIVLSSDLKDRLLVEYEDVGNPIHLDSMTSENNSNKTVDVHSDYLYNTDVSVVVDGSTHEDITLDENGNGVISYEANNIVIGKRFSGLIITKDINAPTGGISNSMSMMKRWSKIFVRMSNSAIPTINGDRVSARNIKDNMDSAVSLYTGDIQVINMNYDRDANIIIEHDMPYGGKILGIFGELSQEKL